MRRSLFILLALTLAGPGLSQIRGGADTAAAGPVAQIATLDGKVSLADVVAACEQTANADQAGAVVIRGSLQDEDCQATLTVPCAIQLDGKARMSLTRCTLQSQTLNVDDSASSAGTNSVKLIDSTLTGQGGAGLLIQLTDPKDRIIVKNSSISYPLGIGLHAPGSRILPDEGGTVVIRKSSLTVSDPTSAGLAATASTSGRGKVVAAKTTVDTPGVLMVAKRCRAVLNGKRIDCTASTLGADLVAEAQAVPGN